MASTMTSSFHIDPAKPSKYPVALSPELLEGDGKVAKQHAAIQCMYDRPFIHCLTLIKFLILVNHKPDLSNCSSETRITPSSSAINRYNLAIKADENRSNYLYSGTQQPSESYALIYDSIKQSFTLDRISTDFTFNLRSTPTVKSSKALASTYPHLDTGLSDSESSSDDLEENDLDSSGADPNNPYDYRHFLHRHRTSSSVSPDLPALISGSPPYHTAPSPKPAESRSTRASPRRSPSPISREEADADNEESDDGGLTIELDPDVRKPRRFQGNFLYDTRNGPISFRSAASSASPAAMVQESSESDEDDDVEVQLETNGVDNMQEDEDGGENEDEDQDEDEDDEHDIENEDNAELENGVEPEDDDDDDDDDDGSLAAELEQAMESQADEEVNGTMHGIENGVGTTLGLGIAGVGSGIRRNPIPDDSSSESEEE